MARQGRARIGTAGMVRLVRQGKVSFGKARRDMAGTDWLGKDWFGRERLGQACRGKVWHGRHGVARRVQERPG